MQSGAGMHNSRPSNTGANAMLNSIAQCANSANIISRDIACNAIADNPAIVIPAAVIISAAIATALFRAI